MKRAAAIAKAKNDGKLLELHGKRIFTDDVARSIHAADVVLFNGKIVKNRYGKVEGRI